MYTLKIVVELLDKFKPANLKFVYRNMVNSDTLDFPYNDLFGLSSSFMEMKL